ncbi:hypothetical protein A1353_00890 [Methylomonas methanica]|uniref:Uncharacterized protein n=1 Tax=Methylomonas methanica TaxID=421 RepID=A0A177M7V0_METMH|nr:hypothetical protein [Methylomonas methanica]OAI01806.1 hypothetical protein A1353_00890 [Methylomonas methanica]
MDKPTRPAYPKWLTPFLWIYFCFVFSFKYLLGVKVDSELVGYLLFLPPLTGIFVTERRHKRELKKYEILELRWKISNVEGWIRYHEKDLLDGQPWFDEQDPNEWEFDKKYSMRRSEETLEELKQKLEDKLQAL